MKRPLKPIKQVGIVANSAKVFSRDVIREAARLVSGTKRTVLTDTPTADLARIDAQVFSDISALSRKADLLLVFGGDGTMLRVARELEGARTPLLGINVGGLGFLTAVPSTDLPHALDAVWAGSFSLESRAMLQATGRAAGKPVRLTALNDVVFGRGYVSRLIELEVTVDDEVLTTYRCDGLIISSPTGTTAYSLAAGGAVVAPSAEVFAITPICPHTLSNRSLIISLGSVIRVKVISSKPETVLSADGQSETLLAPGDTITVCRSPHSVRLLHLSGSSFFKTLRRKLNWRGTHVPRKS